MLDSQFAFRSGAVTYQKEKKSLISFSPVEVEMFLTLTVFADMMVDMMCFFEVVK